MKYIMGFWHFEIERTKHQLSKQDIAKQLGVTAKTYNNYVNGKTVPSSKLILLSGMFNCSVDYLLGLKDNPQKTA